MRYLSLFSGIGGFELGIQKAYESLQNNVGVQGGEHQGENTASQSSGLDANRGTRLGHPICIGFSEIDKYATQIYQKHFPSHKNYGDITKLDPATLPDFDAIVGGFPCQAFSIAGKRGGFDDTRGTLFFEVARIARAKRPRLVFLENVKGLLSHDDGNTFRTIIATLDELGYDVEWQVLNSKDFGVPQNRERVFIIGSLRGEPRPQVFPLGPSGETPSNVQRHVSNTLTTRYEGATATGTYIEEGQFDAQIHQLNDPIHSNDRIYGADGISPSLNTMQGGNRQPKVVIPVLTPDRPNKRQNGRRFKEDGDPSFTLTSQDRHGVLDGMRIRRLTPLECERLQGFPDGWTEGLSDTQRYKTLGNAVTVNVIRAIVEKLFVCA